MTPTEITLQFLLSFISNLSSGDRQSFFLLLRDALEDRLFTDPEQYYLTKKQACSCDIPMDAALLWNQLIQKLSARLPVYRFHSDAEWLGMIAKLNHCLSVVTDPTAPSYRLCSRLKPAAKQFFYRSVSLKSIRRHFLERRSPLFLYGLGGVGKSELARAYAEKYARQYKTVVIAEFSKSLQSTLVDGSLFPIEGLHFQKTGKHGEEGRFFRKKFEILTSLVDEQTLIIIDNFDVLSDKRLAEFTTLPCHLLFTTRTNPSGFGFDGIHVLPLQEIDDCTDLFYRFYDGPMLTLSEQSDVSLVLAELNGHPLAIRQAALFLSQPETTTHMLLEALYDISASPQNVFLPVLQNFRISLLSRRERTVLRYLAVLPTTEISLDEFLDYCCYAQEDDIRRLMLRGLIDMENDIIHIYPLVALAVRETEKKFLKYLF